MLRLRPGRAYRFRVRTMVRNKIGAEDLEAGPFDTEPMHPRAPTGLEVSSRPKHATDLRSHSHTWHSHTHAYAHAHMRRWRRGSRLRARRCCGGSSQLIVTSVPSSGMCMHTHAHARAHVRVHACPNTRACMPACLHAWHVHVLAPNDNSA